MHQTRQKILRLQRDCYHRTAVHSNARGRGNDMLTSSLLPTSSPHSFFAPHTAARSARKIKTHVRPSVIPRILESRSFRCPQRCRFLSFLLLCLTLNSMCFSLSRLHRGDGWTNTQQQLCLSVDWSRSAVILNVGFVDAVCLGCYGFGIFCCEHLLRIAEIREVIILTRHNQSLMVCREQGGSVAGDQRGFHVEVGKWVGRAAVERPRVRISIIGE